MPSDTTRETEVHHHSQTPVKSTRRGCEQEKSQERLREDADLQDEIEKICLKFPKYGYRRLTKQLHRQGWKVNHKSLRIMRKNDLICQIKKVKTRLANSDHLQSVFPNLIKDITITGINQVWVCDITYWTLSPVRLAIISQVIWIRILHSQLRITIKERTPLPDCIHHSDQGIQYASGEYIKEPKRHGLRISMARKGNPYDNAVCKSFIKTLKHEQVYLSEYRSLLDTQRNIVHPTNLRSIY